MQSIVQQKVSTAIGETPAAGDGMRKTGQPISYERFLEGLSEFAHGLRNSLTVIRGSSELLLETGSDETKVFAEMVHKESAHLARLSQDLLDFSRLQRKKYVLTPRWIDLSYLIHNASAEASAFAGNRTVQVLIQEGLPPVYADSDSIQQVIFNLLTNAIERSPEHSAIVLTVSAETESPNYVKVSVCNEGEALSAEEAEHIFAPFAIRYPTASHGKRMWLGLAISKAIIETQRGTISASSANGVGIELAFTLPAATWAPEDNELEGNAP